MYIYDYWDTMLQWLPSLPRLPWLLMLPLIFWLPYLPMLQMFIGDYGYVNVTEVFHSVDIFYLFLKQTIPSK